MPDDFWNNCRGLFELRGRAEGPHAEEAAAAVAAFPRQALHAAVLGFKHPITGVELRFESELPADMTALIEILKQL